MLSTQLMLVSNGAGWQGQVGETVALDVIPHDPNIVIASAEYPLGTSIIGVGKPSFKVLAGLHTLRVTINPVFPPMTWAVVELGNPVGMNILTTVSSNPGSYAVNIQITGK